MAIFSISNVKFSGVSACVPKGKASNDNYDLLSEKERHMLIKTTGIEERRVAREGVTTSDLCFDAAEKLIQELQWNKEEIELLIFVSQSRDYILPATAIILQDRLGLPKTTIAFDLSLGCSGYIYGLSVISSMMSNAQVKKALLLVGDISSLSPNEKDKSTFPLFGDAGTATALEFDRKAAPMNFNLQSDGSGHKAIIIEDGGVRNPLNDASFIDEEISPGITRNRRNLALDGLEVFNFSLREVAPNIRATFEATNTTKDDYDYFVLHQANKLMNESIRKKLKIEAEKVPYTLKEFGNTSSASIPLTLVKELNNELRTKKLNLLFSGFGVGLSWGTATVQTENITCPKLIEI
jgi:3-oxoacyl-[acyl-carrier-protein] synthase-3